MEIVPDSTGVSRISDFLDNSEFNYSIRTLPESDGCGNLLLEVKIIRLLGDDTNMAEFVTKFVSDLGANIHSEIESKPSNVDIIISLPNNV